jgi:hypothetical protein
LARDQQGPGHPELQKIPIFFNILQNDRENYGPASAPFFSARRQDLPVPACKTGQP